MACIGFLTAGSLAKYAFSPDHPTLLQDDVLLKRELERRGHSVCPVVWSESPPAAIKADLVLIRSPWDYHENADAFRRWLRAAEAAGLPLENSPGLVRWNLDKGYLFELQNKGFPVVPSARLGTPAGKSLNGIFDAFGTDRVVIKPLVGASAYRTTRVARREARAFLDGEFQDWTKDSRFMVQPYLPEVETAGEWSLVFFGESFSHSVRKTPARGNFRVQDLHGGSARAAPAPAAAIRAARQVLPLLPALPLYLRMDGIMHRGRFLLMELELFEPELFFRTDSRSPGRFADCVEARLRGYETMTGLPSRMRASSGLPPSQ